MKNSLRWWQWALMPLFWSAIVAIAPAETAAPAAGGSAFNWLEQAVRQHGILLALPAIFLGGLALNLTPCVYPMIPVTLAFFSGQSTGSVRRTVALAASYVLGLSFSYAVLGLLAAQTGALFGVWLQQPIVLASVALIIVALALSSFGFYELRAPNALLQRLGQAQTGVWGAIGMGLVAGLVAAPCIGPFVLSLLLVVSQMANPLAGFVLFFVLGMGMGAPYLFLAVASQRMSRLPKAGSWLVWCKHILGWILLGLALYFVQSLLPSFLARWLAVALFLGAGIHLAGFFPQLHSAKILQRGVGVLLVIAAIAVAWPQQQSDRPGVNWIAYNEAGLEEAQRQGMPVIIDVYADWCIPCVEMDHTTFRHPDVVTALAQTRPMRIDATQSVSEDAERLLKKYDVFGAPTVLFFDGKGIERTDLRLAGFADKDEFLQRLRQIQ